MDKTKYTIILPIINILISIAHFIYLIQYITDNTIKSFSNIDIRVASITVITILQVSSLILNTYLYAKHKKYINKKVFAFFCNQQRNFYISLVLLGDIIISFFIIYEIRLTWKLILGLIFLQLTKILIYKGTKRILNTKVSEPRCLEIHINQITDQA